MKKQLIGALVGSLILFFWQFISWGLVEIHGPQMAYTPKQDAVLQALIDTGIEEGTYFVPRAPSGSSAAEAEAFMNEHVGKPWAIVSYHESLQNRQGMNMFRGWVIDFISVLLLCWLLLKMANLDFKTAVLASLAVGLIGYFTIAYLYSIWFESDSIPYLIDTIVQWGICGAWLGWWLNR